MLALSAPGAEQTGAPGLLAKLCIFLVDDDQADAYLIHRALLRHPAVGEVVHAQDGVQALAMVERGEVEPDLAFIDLHMPRKGGFDLLAALSCRPGAKFPMVVLTSSNMPTDAVRSQLHGATGMITKPCSVAQMETLLALAIDEVRPSGAALEDSAHAGEDAQEITASRLAEAEDQALLLARTTTALRTAFRIAQVGGWEMDFITQRTSFSPEFCTLLGDMATSEMTISESVLFWLKEDRPAFIDALDLALKQGDRLEFEGRSMAPDGATKWWRLLGEPEFVDDRCVALRGAAQDITIWRDSVEREQAATQTADKTLWFLSTMNHEIRTPLNGVLGMAQVMTMGELSALQRQRLGIIVTSGGALLALLSDLLDLSKLVAGRTQLELGVMDGQALADEVRAAFATHAEGRDLALRLTMSASARGPWLADAKRLRQVLQSLISNAVKFTAQGSVTVDVAHSGDRLVIRVQDTGIGIAPYRLGAIFDNFVQADASATRRYGGSGLGLPICQKLLDLMDGEIRAESIEGVGTTLIVSVPLARAENGIAAES